MKPFRLLSAGCIAALVLASVADARQKRLPEPPRASLSSLSCVRALDPSARSFSVTAVMRPVSGTQTLAVKFQLQQKLPGGAYSDLSAPGLGSWTTPSNPPTLGQEPGDVWYVKHPVADLPAPARYRFRVSFRWTGAQGHVLQQTSLLSAVCAQKELRPDLVIDSVTVKPGQHPRISSDYVVAIADTGATDAGPFTVELDSAGQLIDATVAHLGAHQQSMVNLVGPVCQPGSTVTLDPSHQVDVYSRARATAAVSCPAPTAPSTPAQSA